MNNFQLLSNIQLNNMQQLYIYIILYYIILYYYIYIILYYIFKIFNINIYIYIYIYYIHYTIYILYMLQVFNKNNNNWSLHYISCIFSSLQMATIYLIFYLVTVYQFDLFISCTFYIQFYFTGKRQITRSPRTTSVCFLCSNR